MRCRRPRPPVGGSRSQTSQSDLETLSDQALGHVSGVVAPLQVSQGQGAVQQVNAECQFIIRQQFHGVGQGLHLPHGAQRAQQGPAMSSIKFRIHQGMRQLSIIISILIIDMVDSFQ